MTNRDPLRDHIASPRGRSMRPMIDSAFRLLTEGRRFTPIGIAVSIALPFAIIFGGAYLVLGKDGLVQVTSAWGESAEANKALAQQMAANTAELAAFRSDLAAYARRTQKTQEALAVTDYRVRLVCDLSSEQNEGRPKEDWCGALGQGTRFFAPPLGAVTPHFLTHAPWTPQ